MGVEACREGEALPVLHPLVLDTPFRGEVVFEFLVQGHRVQEVGEVLPVRDVLRDGEGPGDVVLDLLDAEGRAQAHEQRHGQVLLLQSAQHVVGDDGALAVGHHEIRAAFGDQQTAQPLLHGRALVGIVEVGGGILDEGLGDPLGNLSADQIREHLGFDSLGLCPGGRLL
jgi:hypothetical protein